MRNWNYHETYDKIAIYGFQTTYEELKQRWEYIYCSCVGCFQTTYEELKHHSNSHIDTGYTASRLPMRNWNIYRRSKFLFFTSFQTTYEELKLEFLERNQILDQLPDYLWGIETRAVPPTYDRLRPLPDYLWGIETIVLSIFPVNSLRFQTTYEELKLFVSHLLTAASVASRLPMRNWNLMESGLHVVCSKASRLPMRNWNARIPLNWVETWCFQTTYEELKPVFAVSASVVVPASRLPMRNWDSQTGLWG